MNNVKSAAKTQSAKWSEHEKDIIERFLVDRLESVQTSMDRIAEFANLELDSWASRSIKYWRWSEGFVRWCLSTLSKTKASNNATNK